MSQFTSLPEIRSFVERNCSDKLKSINNKLKLPSLATSSSFEKSSSWSWKSSENEQIKSKISATATQRQVSHHNDSDFIP
jgi:hypothetical protein